MFTLGSSKVSAITVPSDRGRVTGAANVEGQYLHVFAPD